MGFLSRAGLWRLRVMLLAALIGAMGALPSFANEVHQFDIPQEQATLAIRDFGLQAHVQILAAGENVSGKTLHAVSGELSTEQGLNVLLAGSGLTHQYVGDHAVALVQVSDTTPTRARTQSDSQPEEKAGRSFWDRFRVAQTDQRLGAGGGGAATRGSVTSSTDEAAARKVPGELEEVLVTAQKRTERLQDVPVPVTAISADALLESNHLQLQDYYTSVPGLSLTPALQSSMVLAIRGITTGLGNPTVGIMVDGVPYGASTLLGGGLAVPDIDPGDLQRVEVLRGPQGTLYGASSLGGLLNFVTTDPSTAGVSGRVQGGTDVVKGGTPVGYNVRGSVNVPLTETLAIRASAFTRRDPGYIDNPVLGIDGINRERVSGGRLAALWQPSDGLSVKLSALYQQMKGDGSSDVDVQPGLSGLQQSYVPGAGAYDRKTQAYSAIVTAKVGRADLTSVTGYNINSFTDSFDFSYVFAPFVQAEFGVTGLPAFDDFKTNKFSQELRLSMPLGSRLDVLLGAFYTHEYSSILQDLVAENATSGALVGEWVHFDQPATYAEYAAFADLTVHLTDRFDLQFGGRGSHIRQTFRETDTGPYVPLFEGVSSPNIFPKSYASSSPFTYLVTPSFKLTPDLMLYARLASGYRAGGPNQASGGIVPPQYDPDKTRNYEIGLKGDFLDRRLSIDASAYYIDWKNIQLNLINAQTAAGYSVNGSRAKSQGLELQAELRPLTGLHLSGWVSWANTILTEDMPANSAVIGVSGDRLPYSSRFSGNFSAQQDFPLWGRATGFVGALVSYVGERIGTFATAGGSPQRQIYPAYARTDLHAGARLDSWEINLFLNNVTDRRGLLQGGLGYTPPFAFQYIQPRTTGLSVVKT